MSNLKRSSSSGHLLHNADGNLVRACAEETGCPCGTLPVCASCPDQTPRQFHVTFTGITFCTGCVSCPDQGVSLSIASGASIDGTYVMTQNGTCAWTTFEADVPTTASIYSNTDCSGDPEDTFGFAIFQARISSTQFRLRIADDSNTIVLFDAIVDVAGCCQGYTADNDLTGCGCAGSGPTIITLATGGQATVTPC